jgi:membrane protease YdiL (CAAX protease family)
MSANNMKHHSPVPPSSEGDPLSEPPESNRAEKTAQKWYAPQSPKGILLETLLMFGGSILLCALLWQGRLVSSFVATNLQALIAAIFLYVPTGLLIKRHEYFNDYGLTIHPLGRGIGLFCASAAIIFPLFILGSYHFYQLTCLAGITASPFLRWIRSLRALRSMCRRFISPWNQVQVRIPPQFGQMVLAQLLVVALPEEFFFRGYLQSRLEQVWPSSHRLLGAQVGFPLVVASLLFALGHVLVDFNGLRIIVFFPALVFGWMRQASGSILASVLFHASSNLVSELFHHTFFTSLTLHR